MPGKKHGPSIKKPAEYESLRDKGMSKEKAARISNADAKSTKGSAQKASKKGGRKS